MWTRQTHTEHAPEARASISKSPNRLHLFSSLHPALPPFLQFLPPLFSPFLFAQKYTHFSFCSLHVLTFLVKKKKKERKKRKCKSIKICKTIYYTTVHSVFRPLHFFPIFLCCSLMLKSFKLFYLLIQIHHNDYADTFLFFFIFSNLFKRKKTEISQWHKYSDLLLST